MSKQFMQIILWVSSESLRPRLEVLLYLFFDHSRVHVRNLPDGELGSNLGRDNSLCAGVGEGPLNAMDGDCGVAPHVG